MFYFTPLPGFFSPFPRGTVSLSVTREYLALPRGRGRFTRDFTCPMLLGMQLSWFLFRLQDFHLLWCGFQPLRLNFPVFCHCPTTPSSAELGLGCSLFARRYWGNRCCFLFLWLLRCFSSPGLLAPPYVFRWSCLGLPHSDIFGSMLASRSPKRFVGNYVLLRFRVPRYPPLALISLTLRSSFLAFSPSSMQFSRFLWTLYSEPAFSLTMSVR